MWMVLHFRCHRLNHLEAFAVVQVSALGKTPDIIRVAPKQYAGGSTAPQPPVHLVPLRIAQQIGIAVSPVMLIPGMNVRRMEWKAHLFHPVLGAYPHIHTHLQGLVNQRIREVLCPRIKANIRPVLGHYLIDVLPEAAHLGSLEPRLAVHPKLNCVNVRH